MGNSFKEVDSTKKTEKFVKIDARKTEIVPQHKRQKLLAKVDGHEVFYWLDYGVVMPSLCTTNGAAQLAAQWIVRYAQKGHRVVSDLVVADWTDEAATLYALMTGAKAARQELIDSLRTEYGERTFY